MLAGIIGKRAREMKGWLMSEVQGRFGWVIQLPLEGEVKSGWAHVIGGF